MNRDGDSVALFFACGFCVRYAAVGLCKRVFCLNKKKYKCVCQNDGGDAAFEKRVEELSTQRD